MNGQKTTARATRLKKEREKILIRVAHDQP